MIRRLKVGIVLLWGMGLLITACGDDSDKSDPANAAQVVADYYHWHVGYPGNPLVDRAYRDSDLLSQRLIDAMDDTFAEGIFFDPFLCAQAIPDTVRAEAGESDSHVLLYQTWNAGTEYELEHTLDVTLVRVDGRWRIDRIDCPGSMSGAEATPPDQAVPPAIANEPTLTLRPTLQVVEAAVEGWQVFQDTQHSYQIAYPEDWTIHEIPLQMPELVAPVVRSMLIAPADMIPLLTAAGQPDPNQPPAIPPLVLEVSVGTLEEYRRMYPEPHISTPLTIGTLTAIREEDVFDETIHTIRYWFQHPADERVRVTLIDNISGFYDRAAEHPAWPALLWEIVQTFAFDPM